MDSLSLKQKAELRTREPVQYQASGVWNHEIQVPLVGQGRYRRLYRHLFRRLLKDPVRHRHHAVCVWHAGGHRAGEDCARRGPGYFCGQPVVFLRGVGPG